MKDREEEKERKTKDERNFISELRFRCRESFIALAEILKIWC